MASTTTTATPHVTRLAAELGVPLASIAGTGVGGRISAEDVRAAAARRAPVRASAPVVAAPAEDDGWFPHIVAAERLSELTLAGRSANGLSAEEQRFVREHGHPLQ